MNRADFQVLASLLVCMTFTQATNAAETIRSKIQHSEAWLGERVPVIIEILAPTTFAGAPSFDWPDLPGTTIVKVGNAVVGTEQVDGQQWNVQAHEFAAFTQNEGDMVIPPFPVRYERRGDSGASQVSEKGLTKELRFRAKRPPGTEGLAYVVTTEKMSVDESWNPPPATLNAGEILKRTITQKAESVAGMALAPVSHGVPDGVRVYSGQPMVTDHTERGEFSGERIETMTYLFERAGSYTVPAQKFTWWNPDNQSLQSKVLPSITVEVRGSRATAPSSPASKDHWTRPLIAGALLVCVALACWQGKRRLLAWLDDPECAATWRLRRACAENNPTAAYGALQDWLRVCRARGLGDTIEGELHRPAGEALRAEWYTLQQILYGSAGPGDWHGATLAREFNSVRSRLKLGKSHRRTAQQLPPLNP